MVQAPWQDRLHEIRLIDGSISEIILIDLITDFTIFHSLFVGGPIILRPEQ